MKIALIDVETTGLNPDHHEIIEIGCVVFDSETFEIAHTFESKVKPLYPLRADPKAVQVNGYNINEWKDAPSLYEAMSRLAPLTRDATFCAHNVCFDNSFITRAYDKTSFPMTFSYRKLDIFTLAWSKIPHDKLASWSLKNICIYLNIEPEPDVHSALNGAMKAYEVYKKLMKSD